MSYDPTIAALTFGDTKAAALYFKRVLPVSFASLTGDYKGFFVNVPDPVPLEVAAKLIFGEDAPRDLIVTYLDEYWTPFIRRLSPLVANPKASDAPDAYEELKHLYLSNTTTPEGHSVRDAFQDFARGLGIDTYSVLLPEKNEATSGFGETYAYLALSAVSLIDTSKATWEQIAELRRSPEAARRLRRLRLFFFGTYVGKSRSFVEDDLLRRLDDYERTRKEFGFETSLSVLSVLLDAKSIQSAFVAGMAAAFFGGPVAGLASGAVVELGRVAIEAGKKVAQIRRLHDGHELAYLIDTLKLGRDRFR